MLRQSNVDLRRTVIIKELEDIYYESDFSDLSKTLAYIRLTAMAALHVESMILYKTKN